MKKSILALLLVIFVFAYLLRVMFLPKLSLTFGYDQARDAYVSQQLLKGDWKIIGPPASTPGFYHGVFYYYFLAPAYLVGQGSPIAAAYWVALFNAFTVLIVFYLTYLITKKYLPALLASLLFAVSFEGTQYATWLSNPTIGIWTVPLMYLGLWLWTKERGKTKTFGAITAAVGLGLSIQAEIFLLYQAVPLVLWLYINRKAVFRKQLIVFSTFLVLSVLTMVISEIKFGFKAFHAVPLLLTSQDALVAVKSLGDFFVLFLNQIGKVFAYASYPGNIGYGGIFVFFVIVYVFLANYRKDNNWPLFLILWLFSHLTVVSVGGTSTPFLLVGIGPAVSIILAIFIAQLITNKKKFIAVFILVILVFSGVSTILKQNVKGSVIFAIQKDMLLAKQLKLIDDSYQLAGGEPFSLNSLTSPLWINIVWTYLYEWYGREKYNYLPEWHGRDQVGQLASLPKTMSKTTKYYLILEPMGGIPEKYLNQTISEEDALSKFISERNYGELKLQEREKLK